MPRPPKRINRYDESVKDFFTSKTFKTLMTIGLVLGCCFATCSFLYYGSLVGLLDSLLSLPPKYQTSISTQQAPTKPLPTQNPPTHRAPTQRVLEQPYIAGETNENNPIDDHTEALLNAWLATSAPVDTQYWFITGWDLKEDGRMFVSLAAVDLSSPNEMWHMTGERDGTNKVLWFGSVEVNGDEVKLY